MVTSYCLALLLAFPSVPGGSLLGVSSLTPLREVDSAELPSRSLEAPLPGETEEQALGRETWTKWTAGNQMFWRKVCVKTGGEIDLLKLITVPRAERWEKFGVMNDPGCRAPAGPDQHGLPLDEVVDVPSDAEKAIYGEPTGIVGVRKYPNPSFGKSGPPWDAQKYLKGPFDKTMEPPYVVGISCAICHAGPDPLRPPSNPSEPRWENIKVAIGNQYLREWALFASQLKEDDFRWHVKATQEPGTSDTSTLASDHINNPDTVHPIFNLTSRLSLKVPERITPKMRDIIMQMPAPVKADLVEGPDGPMLKTPHVLKDGADSVGMAFAALRGYLNIGGMDHEQFLDCWGSGPVQKVFDVQRARMHPSGLWMKTEKRMPAMQAFLETLKPLKLADAPGGAAYLGAEEKAARGKNVFAAQCARCHSPETDFFSDDKRYSIDVLGTNAARALASNATAGHIWEPFSSETHKQNPSASMMKGLYNPFDPAKPIDFQPPGGGRGYYRTPTLVSIWATAPFLHNNALGTFVKDPSVAGRMRAFDDAIQKLLWPEKRLGPASIKRTSAPSKLPGTDIVIPAGTPVNLIANVHPKDMPAALEAFKQGGFEAAVPALLKVNQCPDFIEDRGHTFGSQLPDEDKWALIEYLKRL